MRTLFRSAVVVLPLVLGVPEAPAAGPCEFQTRIGAYGVQDSLAFRLTECERDAFRCRALEQSQQRFEEQRQRRIWPSLG